MTAKEYLLQIKDTSKKIVALGCELEEVRSQKDGLSGVALFDKVKTSATYKNSLDDLIMREEEILNEQREVRAEWWRCREMIKAIDNPLYSDVLRYYYLLNYDSWDKVANRMHKTERAIYKIHGNALQEFRKISNFL